MAKFTARVQSTGTGIIKIIEDKGDLKKASQGYDLGVESSMDRVEWYSNIILLINCARSFCIVVFRFIVYF